MSQTRRVLAEIRILNLDQNYAQARPETYWRLVRPPFGLPQVWLSLRPLQPPVESATTCPDL